VNEIADRFLKFIAISIQAKKHFMLE